MSWGFSRQQQQQAPQFILLHSLAWLCEGSTREYRVPLSYTSQYFRLTSICLRLTRSSLSLWSGKKGVGGIDVIKYALRHGWIWDWLKVQLFFSSPKEFNVFFGNFNHHFLQSLDYIKCYIYIFIWPCCAYSHLLGCTQVSRWKKIFKHKFDHLILTVWHAYYWRPV